MLLSSLEEGFSNIPAELACQKKNSFTIKKMIEEVPNYQYNDGTRLLFLSTLPTADGSMSNDLRSFLDYVDGKVAASELTDRIETAVKKARRQASWRKEYMLFYEYLDEAKAEGREEGREETLAELVRDGILELSEAAKRAGLSEEEFLSKSSINLTAE